MFFLLIVFPHTGASGIRKHGHPSDISPESGRCGGREHDRSAPTLRPHEIGVHFPEYQSDGVGYVMRPTGSATSFFTEVRALPGPRLSKSLIFTCSEIVY